MYSRVIRAEVWESERFCDLHSDSHRLLFLALVARADDFGNVEAKPRTLFRWARNFTQIKEDAALLAAISALCDADICRAYTVDGTPYLHLPRFDSSRRWMARVCPPSPWCDLSSDVPAAKSARLSKRAERQKNQALAKMSSDDIPTTVGLSSDCRLRGVGVGVGVELPESPLTRSSLELSLGRSRDRPVEYSAGFLEFWNAYPRKTKKDAAFKAWRNLRPKVNRETLDGMLQALTVQRGSVEWAKDGGQFIPHPATWLNAGQWKDEPVEATDTAAQAIRLLEARDAEKRPAASDQAA